MDYQNADQGSYKVWYIIGIVVILAFWYFYGMKKEPVTVPASSVVEQIPVAQPTSGNTTADISTDLNQIADTAAVLAQDAPAAPQELQGLKKKFPVRKTAEPFRRFFVISLRFLAARTGRR